MNHMNNKVLIKIKRGLNRSESLFNMIYVKGGTFLMGANTPKLREHAYDNEVVKEVTVDNFYIMETLLTYDVAKRLWLTTWEDSNQDTNHPGKPALFWANPGYGESMYSIIIERILIKINQETKKKFRLPTEAEWEYAARGGNLSKGYIYSGSDDSNEVAWHKNNIEELAPYNRTLNYVKKKKPNELGLYDMSGLAFELCADAFIPSQGYPLDYKDPKLINPVLKGGSIFCPPEFSRVSWRFDLSEVVDNIVFGVRLVIAEEDLDFDMVVDSNTSSVTEIKESNIDRQNILGKEYVDLGLSSGTLWARHNVDAENDSLGRGCRILPQERFSRDITLPTIEQMLELHKECKWTYMEKEECYRVTGTNGESIILPWIHSKANSAMYMIYCCEEEELPLVSHDGERIIGHVMPSNLSRYLRGIK